MFELWKLKDNRDFVGYHINEFSRVGTNYGQNYDCRRTMSGTFDSLGLHVFINEHLFSHFSLFKKDIIELMKYSISTSHLNDYILILAPFQFTYLKWSKRILSKDHLRNHQPKQVIGS